MLQPVSALAGCLSSSGRRFQQISSASDLLLPTVRILRHIALSLLLLSAWLVPQTVARAQPGPEHHITWDSHSLLIDGQRVLLYSGEFHYWRLPSRSQWLDRLEKMKAAGLNAVSVYFDWQYHSWAPGQYDFAGVRDIEYLLALAERVGLYVIARVGPYMNAEVDAGGLPGWVLTKQVFPRAQTWDGTTAKPQYSPLYTQYSQEWYAHLLPILARHQVTTGGCVILLSIENEYNQDTGSGQYMQDLYNFARADGIQVPIFHNDFYFKGDWSKLVDLYAYDSYPYGFQCCHQWWDQHFHGVDTWEATLRQKLNITTPMFVSELQGGAFDPWGGQGYDAVARTLGADWLTLLDESALAQGTTLLNTYMFVGGTTWGYMSEPGVYTSYDYGAPIAESGSLRPAYYAAHRLGLFLQSYGSSLAAANPMVTQPTASDASVVVHARTDPDNGRQFIFLRHGDAGAPVETKLQLNLGGRSLEVPEKQGSFITLPGHGGAILLANVDTGPLHLNYSTSQVLTDAQTAGGEYLVLYGPPGSGGETNFVLPAGSVSVTHNAGVQVTRQNGELRLNYHHTQEPRTIVVTTTTGTLRIVVTSTDAASRFWSVNNLLVSGPDLVTADGGAMKIFNHRNRDVQVFGGSSAGSFSVNGHRTAQPDQVMGETMLGVLNKPGHVPLPILNQWKFQSEAPEVSPTFDDHAWVVADHPGTTNPNVPAGSTLLADDYGFHYGFVWYRGHFTATGAEQGINIEARHSYSVYLNGVYLGGDDAPLTDPPHPYGQWKYLPFPAGSLHQGTDSVIAVLTESFGHDPGWVAGPAAQSPQGILGAQLQGAPTPITWRLQGNAGGEQPADTTRGLMNASGLYGEREGWYLPSFNDTGWSPVVTPDSWHRRGVTSDIGWYRTHFQLSLPVGSKIPIGLTLPHVADQAVIWLNGWQLGRYWEQRGPQHTFYLPEGILNPRGDNVLAIAVWNRGHEGGLVASPSLMAYGDLKSQTVATVAPKTTGIGYWHTQGNRIVDSEGSPVRIAAVNWSGMQNVHFVPAGLDHQPLDSIVQRIRSLGFNTIRLPFSNQLVEQNPEVTSALDANPGLKGLHALDIMDRIVAAAKAAGLRVILDNHRSDAGTDPELNGLWYTKQYPEAAWIQDWDLLARRYQGDPTVIGMDLRDEPHTGPPGPWSVNTYLHQGATWGPYRGVENQATDWRLAAERAGDSILSINPNLLIFVEGLQQYPDPSQAGGIDSYWWGGIFQPAARYPVALKVPNHLVYSPHEYGPMKYRMPFFGPHMSYDSQAAVWQKHWGFLEDSSARQQVPIFIGEFGTCQQSIRCLSDSTPGSQGQWFSIFMTYLQAHPEINWSFWALNGTNPANHTQPNYILNDAWTAPRFHPLLDTLRDIELAPPPAQ